MVLFGHLRNPLFLGYGDLTSADRILPVKAWYFVTGWHAEAVIVFFVLSGFLVGGLGAAKASIGKFSPVSYGIDRVTRIYVAFLPALLLTVVLDLVGSSVFSGTGFYDHTHPMIQQKIATEPFITLMTMETFWMNAALLQTFLAPPFGSNQPLWTISAEFWFYVVFGLGFVAIASRSGVARTLAVALTVVIFLVLGVTFPILLGLWLIGACTTFVPWRAVERPLISLLVFAAVLSIVRFRQDIFEQSEVIRTAKNYLVAATFAWLLISMRHIRFLPLERLSTFNRFMADFSYSLYLIHFPLMLFLLGLFHVTGGFEKIVTGYSPRDPQGLFLYAAIIVLIFATAYLFSLLGERQTWKIRRALKAVVFRRSRRTG